MPMRATKIEAKDRHFLSEKAGSTLLILVFCHERKSKSSLFFYFLYH